MAEDTASPDFDFNPIPLRDRIDGWSPEKQVEFIAALAETGCVNDACRRVGMSKEGAYRLKRHMDGMSFRVAWDAALNHAIKRLSDEAMSRAIYGVPVPHYYKGEVVGEHRKYDERLTQFLLRYRAPQHYGKILDQCEGAYSDEQLATYLARVMVIVGSEILGQPNAKKAKVTGDVV